jgi:ElaB/YqjD/DUF883 family membrane-anchored ribosome-binding protein
MQRRKIMQATESPAIKANARPWKRTPFALALLLCASWSVVGCDSDESTTRPQVEAGRDTKDTKVAEWRRDLATLDGTITEWSRDVESGLDKMSDDARKKYEEVRSNIAKQRDAFAASLDEAGTAVGTAWKDVEASLQRTWDSLKRSFDQARQDIGKS